MNGLIFTGMPNRPYGDRGQGAYRIATHLRNSGQSVEVVDFFPFWSDSDLRKLITIRHNTKPIDWIGFSFTWFMPISERVNDVINALKQFIPDVKIIIGGNFKSIPVLDNADYFINGFAERAIVELLGYLEGKNKKPFGRPVLNKSWHIDALNFYPAWNLEDYNIEFLKNDYITEHTTCGIEFARGCRFKCKFCEFPVLGVKDDVSLSEETIYRQLQSTYDKWGITSYITADETLNDREEKLIKIRNAVKRLSFTPTFSGFVRVDLLHSHPHWIEIMAESRIIGQYYGIETFNHETGKIIGKGLDPELVKDALLKTKEYFYSNNIPYRGTISMIAGLPKESMDSLSNSIKWLEKNWNDQSTIWFPLHISRSDNLKLNAFGEDFSKYGYSEMPSDAVEYELTNNFDLVHGDYHIDIPTIYYQNEYGNYFEFRKWVYDNTQTMFEKYKNSFGIIDLLSIGYSLDEALQKPQIDGAEAHYRFEQILNRYVMRKLSNR